MKVLIVEDDEPNMVGLTRLIQASWKLPEMQLEIVGVRTLEAALKEADTANVTILDLGLPDSDMVNTIQSIPNFRPPVIVMTGHGEEGVVAACMKHGASHVFTKGSAIGLIPLVFESMQKDIVRRASERMPDAR